MTEIIAVQVNCANGDEAAHIAAEAIRERLAASANIHAPVASTYRWQGRIVTATEVPLVLKTRAGLFAELSRLIARLHSYETPGILAVDAVAHSATYRDWIVAETREPTE